MSLQDECELSYYQPIASLSPGHPVSLVQHTVTHRLYVRKDLTIFNEAVYRTLQRHPAPGIPKVEMVLRDGDKLIVIEEYVNGTTLSDRLSGGPFYEQDAARLMQRICETVRQLHAMTPPIIHRDLKPSNIMLTQDGSVWLLDLNAAKFADPAGAPLSPGASPARDTLLIGTAGYAAPEQYGFGVSTIQTDIYALGVLYRTLLTGDPASAAPLPPETARIIRRATELDPANRYASLDPMIAELSRIGGLPAKARKPMRFPYAPPGFRRGVFWHGLLAVLYYLPVLFFGLGMSWPDRSAAYNWFNRLSFLLVFLMLPFVTFNYAGILDKLKVTRIRSLPLRLLVILLLDAALFLLCMLVITGLELLLF